MIMLQCITLVSCSSIFTNCALWCYWVLVSSNHNEFAKNECPPCSISFCLQCGMARMPNPALLVIYASFLIEARKDGQAARTQLQLAQKASPSILDNYNIYVAQQLSKQLKRGEKYAVRSGSLMSIFGLVPSKSKTCCNAVINFGSHHALMKCQRHLWVVARQLLSAVTHCFFRLTMD